MLISCNLRRNEFADTREGPIGASMPWTSGRNNIKIENKPDCTYDGTSVQRLILRTDSPHVYIYSVRTRAADIFAHCSRGVRLSRFSRGQISNLLGKRRLTQRHRAVPGGLIAKKLQEMFGVPTRLIASHYNTHACTHHLTTPHQHHFFAY